MGLLSDPEYGSVKWVRILKKVHAPLCVLCYIGALVWFLALASKEFNNETYFSENALLPGLATNEFNAEQSAKQFYNEFLQELEDKYEDKNEMPVPWLVAKMSQLHLEVYTHNFTLNYPLGYGEIFQGTNVYGILRAPRTSSLEALVISVPFRSISFHQKGTAAGIALMLAFAQFARPQKYWAKDIIFLITEHEQLGMQAWLEAYHGLQIDPGNFYTSMGSFYKPGMPRLDFSEFAAGFSWLSDNSKCLKAGQLKGRSGSIQAAINLEFHTPKIKYIEVKVEGLNGQLPNLDLVNLVLKLCVKSGIHHSYKNSYSWIRNRNKMEEWTNSIWTMLEMVNTQLAGTPTGNHGLFHRFGIEAVTLEGRGADDPSGTPPKVAALTSANFYRLGNALESIMRSLNNLLERFHQSYFFYLLAATNRFISIGQYMPSLCLLCVAMLIRALALWVTIQKDVDDTEPEEKKEAIEGKGTEDTKKTKTEAKEDDEKKKNLKKEEKDVKVPGDKEVKDNVKVPGDKEVEKVDKKEKENKSEGRKEKELNISVVSMGANYLLVHLLGYAVISTPNILSKIGATYFNLNSEVSVYHGLILVSILQAAVVSVLPYLLRRDPVTREELTLVNILVLVELATACLAIGMHNYALGLFVATIYTPLALLIRVADCDSGSTFVRAVHAHICLLLHPLCAVTIALMLYSWKLFPEEGFGSMVRGRDAAMMGVMFSIVDSLIFGNWLFNVCACVLVPAWLILWQIACARAGVPPPRRCRPLRVALMYLVLPAGLCLLQLLQLVKRNV